MLVVLLALSLSLFIFKNSLYFTIILLAISMLTLSYLVLNTMVGNLTAFMLIIVYPILNKIHLPESSDESNLDFRD